ncbi:MAG TPA: DUF3291 domain-containing protein [Hyphomonadaceae bacterium]|nr:DUF3291 domain-containing protein [Hyphomonadaceae bacterium]
MTYHLAQINIGTFRVAREDPINASFEAALDEVNALAEASPGFIWRMQGEGDSDDPGVSINMTVWRSIDDLAAFAYRNITHRTVMRRRREWFIEMPVYLALWWIRAGESPTLQQGLSKLDLIGRVGPTPDAFDFRTVFPPPVSKT